MWDLQKNLFNLDPCCYEIVFFQTDKWKQIGKLEAACQFRSKKAGYSWIRKNCIWNYEFFLSEYFSSMKGSNLILTRKFSKSNWFCIPLEPYAIPLFRNASGNLNYWEFSNINATDK